MSVEARARAKREQLSASDPAVSAFVAASAGSGKTKLLTDRLLRLMLGGADPARIQCLTFTKAAAAEMALRLQGTLGAWVVKDDAALDVELRERGLDPTAAARASARALFARVLDLPGGMRIGTIHAFCQSLLRRFPLEAQLSPHFSLVDDIDAAVALRAARESMLAGAHTADRQAALMELAGLLTAEQFGNTATTLQIDRDRLTAALALGPDGLAEAQRRVLGATRDEPALLRDAATWGSEPALREALLVADREATQAKRDKAAGLLGWLALDAAERAEHWDEWVTQFLLDDGKPRGIGALLNPKLAKSRPDLVEIILSEQARIAAVQDDRRAIRVAVVSAALVTLAAPVARAYAAHKAGSGLVDYDDLIGLTSRLLIDPGAAWVLFKLDGGLDHLLLDEVQDTAPAQWRIAGALTQEFFAGAGANDAHRTVFAVGDLKQSIYSFQGADPAAFAHWRGVLRRRVDQAGQQWRDVALDVSFRSAPPVLELVDAVFEGAEAAAGVTAPGELRHIPDRAGQAGRVELWPLTPLTPPPPTAPWQVPERNIRSVGAPQRLADALADWLARRIGTEPLRGRTLAAGDVLVLVRRRNAFATALVRALKSRHVPVAGLDRLVLTDQPAIADLLALCDTLLLPEDDLQLACVLTSPLGGLDGDSLMALAAGRDGTLWRALGRRADERPDWARAHAFIAALLSRVDYATPHALLSEALGPLGGRSRLFARLGPEAAEPVDELLGAALAYGRGNPPSLQGFVHWLRQSGAEVKREPEGAGGSVRIMTVHGAKGLQAPLVILPDTTALPPDDGPLMWAEDAVSGVAVPVWSPRKELRCAAIQTLRQAAVQRREEEHNRLLYVALTRAEDRLLVCGWATSRALPPNCWYELVRQGFAGLSPEIVPFGGVSDAWDGETMVHEAEGSVDAPAHGPAERPVADAPLPEWAGMAPHWHAIPPDPEPARPSRLAPSRPENAGLGTVPQADSPLSARDASGRRFARGQLVHVLLQHLPALPPDQREAAARQYLTRLGHGLDAAGVDQLAAEVLGVLAHPDLAGLFGPHSRAEAPLSGLVAGRVVGGLVDRLAVTPDRVLIADYKTNRDPPADAASVPPLYLRQMAAYRAVLRQVFPDRAVSCALVWTTGVRVMQLPGALLDQHAPGSEPTDPPAA